MIVGLRVGRCVIREAAAGVVRGTATKTGVAVSQK
jgi:hypothetical protein